MDKAMLEYMASEAIDRAKRGELPEHDRVELKRDFPDQPPAAARRLAALANAARGEDVVLVIGIDEKTGATHAVTGELSNWWAGICRWFDGEPPAMVAWHATDALLLGFDTTSGPYVVKTRQSDGEKGQPTHEVPWREGNQTRTARRRDLIQLLVPAVRVPAVEVLSGELRIDPSRASPQWNMSGWLEAFLAPSTRDLLTFPAHKASMVIETTAEVSLSDVPPIVNFSHVAGSLVNASGTSQVYLDAPGRFKITFSARFDDQVSASVPVVRVVVMLHPVPEGPPLRVVGLLQKVGKTNIPELIWRLDGHAGQQ